MGQLKATYSNESEIPEGLSDYYKKQADGTFKIDLAGGTKTQADVDRVKSSLQKERDENEELKRKLSGVPDDFDAEKWNKVKDIDPDQDFSGDLDEEAEKEIKKRVSEQVRKKEQEIKDDYKSKLSDKESEIDQRKETLADQHKESWVKTKLAEEFGFTEQKRLRWMMLDIKAGQYPELKRKIEEIESVYEDGQYKIKGGELNDKQGAFEILENIAQMDATKDYKPADGNSGGGAHNEGGDDKVTENPYEEETWNLTEQGKLEDDNPKKAKALASQAGIDI